MLDSIEPVKKRKAAGDPPLPGKYDDRGSVLSSDLSLDDLNRLIDQRVEDAVEAKTLALNTRVDGLQREIEGLLHRCESLERSVQVLKSDGNWTYSAPDIPRSHWIEQGHDDEYAGDADYLIEMIKESTENLRLAYNNEVEVGNSENLLILSDDALDPHWEELANAVQLSERVGGLCMWNVQLDEGTLQMIEASVRQKGITKFDLTGNSFLGGEGVKFAIDVLKSNRSVETFGWCDNSFHSIEDACNLIDAVLEQPTISNVVLSGSLTEVTIPYAPIQRLFGGVGTNTLQTITLTGNGIKTNGDRCISDFLATNPSLIRLDLGGNRLDDEDALHIGLALQSNTNLRYLNLEYNSLAGKGKRVAYYQAVFGLDLSNLSELDLIMTANLNTVSEANHKCRIVGLRSGPKDFMNDDDESESWNRGKKLFFLLVLRHRKGHNITQLESEFSGDDVGLVPRALACINVYSGEYYTSCLSIIFELVRNWKMPEMYQFQHGNDFNPE